MLAFDAEQSVDVVLPLQITFAPQSDETAGLVAVANSSLTVTADEAYVVVIPQRFYGPRSLAEKYTDLDCSDIIVRII